MNRSAAFDPSVYSERSMFKISCRATVFKSPESPNERTENKK